MRIDDFDPNEINDRLAVKEDSDISYSLSAAHGDGHDDISGGGTHGDGHDDVSGPIQPIEQAS
jgi:hypothetical protein